MKDEPKEIEFCPVCGGSRNMAESSSICQCNGIQPYSMSNYPGEHKLVKTHPSNGGEHFYLRSDVDKLIRQLKKKSTLEDNIQRAAWELPEGWTIEISVENHSGWVDLQTPDGNSVDVSGDRNLAEQVSEAISYAKEHDERT